MSAARLLERVEFRPGDLVRYHDDGRREIGSVRRSDGRIIDIIGRDGGMVQRYVWRVEKVDRA